MSVKPLHICSTFTRDLLSDTRTGRSSVHKGGPAFFLKKACEEEGIVSELHVGPKVDVRIHIDEHGEVGTVSECPPNSLPSIESGSSVIVSTIMQEWNPEVLAHLGCSLYLDVQGFVRAPGVGGTKTLWQEFSGPWTESVRCLKATKEELLFLPKQSVEDQKQRMLIVTHGANGAEVFLNGERSFFVPSKIVLSSNTVGAGDTFFGHVVCEILKGRSVKQTVLNAMNATIRFLEKKDI